MYHTSFSGFGEAKAGSSYVRKFQGALAKVGFSPGKIDGTYGANTRTAMNAYQAAHGSGKSEFPATETMRALGIPPQDWAQTVSDAGGYPVLIMAAQKAAAVAMEPDEEAPPAAAPPAYMPPAAAPPAIAPPGVVPSAVTEPPPAFAPPVVTAAGIGLGPWFKKNWKWFAIGGGIGAVGLIGVLLTTRKEPVQEVR